MEYALSFVSALALTLMVENIALFLVMRHAFSADYRRIGIWKILFAGILASSLTLPCLWFVMPAVLAYPHSLVVGELLVFIAEAFIYYKVLGIDLKKAAALSLICNLCSFLIGLAII